jgi:S1-C subfamily serine protease
LNGVSDPLSPSPNPSDQRRRARPDAKPAGDRVIRVLLAFAVILLAVIVAQPHLDRLIYAAPRTVEARGSLAEGERTGVEIFERVSPSVVQVAARPVASEDKPAAETGRSTEKSSSTDEDHPAETGDLQAGSGIVWDTAGHLVTNSHVVSDAGAIVVRFASGEMVEAELAGTSPDYDIAVLRPRSPRHLPPPIALGSSADLKVGQWAFSIGSPFGLDQSLTSGIISAIKRRLPTDAGHDITNVIQTDAAINPGNSGGPLLDSAGRLIVITTAILSPSGSNAGISFAIPVDVINRVVPQLIRTGRVATPGIGVVAAGEAVTTRLGKRGIMVLGTSPGSPAERAGLRGADPKTGAPGDIIVAVNGAPIHSLDDLTDQIERVGIGSTIELATQRDGQTKTVHMRVADVGDPAKR